MSYFVGLVYESMRSFGFEVHFQGNDPESPAACRSDPVIIVASEMIR